MKYPKIIQSSQFKKLTYYTGGTNENNSNIICWTIDSGASNHMTNDSVITKGIIQQFTVSYNPLQNGRSERFNKTI